MMNFSFGGQKHRGSSNDRKRAAKAGKPRLARRGLQMESLEERSMLAFNPLVISEINYNPPANYNGGDKDKYEFIELYNAGFAPLQLAGVRVDSYLGLNTKFIDVTIQVNRLLQPGDYALVVFDAAAMQERYGADIASKIVGTFTLTNGNGLPSDQGTIRLRTPAGINETISIDFDYDDGDTFPSGADGEGPTLELAEPTTTLIGTDYENPNNWNSSDEYGGSPGRAPAVEVGQRVVINEILANSNDTASELDKIEIVNVSKDPINLGGWMLTDNGDTAVGNPAVDYLHGYVIPNNTILQPGQYMVFTEAQFAASGPNAFSISSAGGTLYLISREENGVRWMEDTIDYDATRQSQSIGRVPDLKGEFLPLTTQTFGAANSAHVVSPVVISEVMYKRSTPNTALNYVELTNRTSNPVSISGWELGGLSTVFAGALAVTIPANKSVVLVSFNPTTGTAAATFRSTYGIDSSVTLIGPWNPTSSLSPNGERLTLMQPYQDPDAGATTVLADSVDFNDDSPWPEGPAGGIAGVSYSLNRTSLSNVGDLPHSWRGALPTPGSYTAPTTTSLLDGLVISEIMYNPTAYSYSNGNPQPSNHLEFVEIYNPTNNTLNLSNAGLAQGVDFRFLSGVTIAPGERIVITPFNPAVPSLQRDEFSSAYGIQFPGSVRTYGPWTQPGSLSNGGEGLALVDNLGNTIFEFEYNNRGGWPGRADAGGSSLELINPDAVPIGVANTAPYLNDPTKWRASSEYRGTPGFASSTTAPSIVINEIQSHTDFQYSDAIELYNASATAVDLSGWFLTDNPAKQFSEWFEIPAMVLQPGEYVTFDACPDPEFPCPSGVPHLPFSLDAAEGEEVYLLSPSNPQGDAYFADHVSIEASFNNVTYGRWPNGSGLMFPMSARTLSQYNTAPTIPTPGTPYANGANSGPVNGDVVISEIMYNPSGVTPSEFEYIELQNTLGVAALLGPIESGAGWVEFDPVGWRLKGMVDFEFKQQHQIPALGTMLLVSFDPVAFPDKLAAFRSRYSVAASVPIVGPFQSYRTISDDGGELTLDRPDEGPGVLPVEERFSPNVLVDRVIFDDVAPWPTSADGGGQSLTRTGPTAYGNAVASWTAAAPTPGSVSSTPTGAPKVTAVTLNGSTWAPAFVTAVSAGNPTPGFTVAKGTQQSAVIPWEKINQVSITFDKAVTIASGALAIRGLNTANYTVSATPTNPSGSTYTWTITTPIVGDRLLIELDDTKVTSSGSSLDGEWTDNTSTGNSGNGTAGGDFKFRVNILPGDVDGDGDTQNDDRMDVRLAMFTSTSVGGSTYSTRRDLDGSGKINVVDFIIARNHLNKTLPAGTPNSPAAPDSVVVRADRSDRRVTATTARAVTRAAVDQALSTDILSGSDATGSDAAESSTMLRARRAGRAVMR